MSYDVRILADSISPTRARLTTFEVTFPRMVLSEFNTHCALSRNSASSRAVPVHKKIHEALADPFVPEEFGRNQAGMSAQSSLSGAEHAEATAIWLEARDAAVVAALRLLLGHDAIDALPLTFEDREAAVAERLASVDAVPPRLDVHKQIANRLLEPFLWHTVIATATDWSNFFALRTAPAAQPELRKAALWMRDSYAASTPRETLPGDWHLPLLQPDEVSDADADPDRWARISAARCARVSYLTHHGVRDRAADLELADRLLREGHMSPFEHVARCMNVDEFGAAPRVGKLKGWISLRSTLPDEADFSAVLARGGQ